MADRGKQRKRTRSELSMNADDDSYDSDNDPLYWAGDPSDSEPEFECEDWDHDCHIVEIKPQNSITGYHLMPSCSKDPNQNSSKKLKATPEIHSKYLTSDFKSMFQSSWNNNEKCKDDGFELITDPFKVCIIKDFLEDANIFTSILEQFNEIDWNKRTMDLYEFFQSKDLKHLTELDKIRAIYQFLQNSVMKWVAELTGLELTHMSATCSYYSNTDFLLVHDDQRKDRMVAFVLYFTGSNGWCKEKGGALQLLDRDEIGHPRNVVQDILPSNNQFVFFPVTNKSYHQVAEVTSLNDCRFSINGWFHTKTPPIFDIPPFEHNPISLFGPRSIKSCDIDISLDSWLNEDYLKTSVIKEVQTYFEEHSEISLKEFLSQECFAEISLTLESSSITWHKVGPPNRYCYEVAKTEELPHLLDRLVKLFQSKQMFTLLRRYTDLNLTAKTATMKYELQKWTPGCYSLLTDYDWQKEKELDVAIYFGCKYGSHVIGARTQYVMIEEETEAALITFEPEENNLNIVYRDTARFTQYYSKQSKCQYFFVLFCSYAE